MNCSIPETKYTDHGHCISAKELVILSSMPINEHPSQNQDDIGGTYKPSTVVLYLKKMLDLFLLAIFFQMLSHIHNHVFKNDGQN